MSELASVLRFFIFTEGVPKLVDHPSYLFNRFCPSYRFLSVRTAFSWAKGYLYHGQRHFFSNEMRSFLNVNHADRILQSWQACVE
ncbi:hypothetical protein P5V15_008012 [Pogonomyrmex californicus]